MPDLSLIHSEVSERLTSRKFFSDADSESPKPISVITEELGDLNNRIAMAVQAVGVCVLILTPTLISTKPDIPGPQFDQATLLARVIEQTTLNRSSSGTRQSCLKIAIAAAKFIHHFSPPSIGSCLLVQRIELAEWKDGVLTYDVVVSFQAGINPNEEPTRSA